MKREDLCKSVWDVCEKLRESVDAWDFKAYALGFLFYKYISEDFANYVNEEMRTNDPDFNYEDCKDNEEWIDMFRQEYIKEKGYFIYPSQLFIRVCKRAILDNKNLNCDIRDIFEQIERSTKISDSEDDFDGLFRSINTNDVKLGKEVLHRNHKLTEILNEINEKVKLTALNPDEFGHVYEYLIEKYASSAGKSQSDFYTPPEVAELLVILASENRRSEIKRVYDPACGSGSLLLRFLRVVENGKDIEFCGQEINQTTYDLCRMNMLLHGVNYDRFDIKLGDTLTHDKFKDSRKKFDAIVSNPPYAYHWPGKDDQNLRNDERFAAAGVLAPKKKADFAFIQHSLHYLSNGGTAAIVCFAGILYREKEEQKIRQWLVEQNYVDAIIQLTDKLLYGDTNANCIMVLKKAKADSSILFIDASTIFTKATNRHQLTKENLEQIIQMYRDRKDVENYSKLVDVAEVKEKEYKLSVSDYVIRQNLTDEVDIVALNKEIEQCEAEADALRSKIKELLNRL